MIRVSPGSLMLLLAGVTAPIRAQVLHDHSVGGIAGLSFSKAGGADATTGSKVVTGFGFGAFVTVGFTSVLAVEPQLLLVEKGLKSEDNGLSATVKITYIQVPLLLKLRWPMRTGARWAPFIYAGPAIGLKVGCRLTLAQGGNSLAGGCSNPQDEQNLKTLDTSAIFGAGVDIGRATVSLRYDLGLSSIDGSSDPSDIKNRSLMLLAGARFRLTP